MTQATQWSRRYQSALRNYVVQDRHAEPLPAVKLGRDAMTLGLETLDVARIHAHALGVVVPADANAATRRRMIAQGRRFFAEAIISIEGTHPVACQDKARVHHLSEALRLRMQEWSASARRLKRGIVHRQAAEVTLGKSERQHARLLIRAQQLQQALRTLTHANLLGREKERQRISRQLHDEVAQALLAIHLRLLAVKTAARTNTANLKKEIADTQRLVKQSVRSVKRIAHECSGPDQA